MPKKKAFWKSKTFWLNMASLGLYAAAVAVEQYPEAKLVKVALPIVVPVLNILVRGMTKQGIALKDE